MKKWVLILGLALIAELSYSQDTAAKSVPAPVYPPAEEKISVSISDSSSSKKYKKRQWLIGGLSVAGYGGSLLLLNETWYKKYPKTSFHSFNDSKEWLQMDKVGHAWTAYNTSRASAGMWKWAGLSQEKSVLVGSLSGFGYLTVIEILDAQTVKWGWSWADMAANFSGSALFAAQELKWKEQKINFKFSAHYKEYDSYLQNRANNLFGKSLPERLLKDYNGQTYWFSFNLHSLSRNSSLPVWLNLSIGYGADNLFGGYENKVVGEDGRVVFQTDAKRIRQWYLAPDIDFTKIKTNRKGIKLVLTALNAFKMPAPAVEFSNGKFKGHWLMF